MKKAQLLMLTFLMFLSACSAKQTWPESVSGNNFNLTMVNTGICGNMKQTIVCGNSLTESEIIQQSALIAEFEITEEPHLYQVNYLGGGKQAANIIDVYAAKVSKVYYSNSKVKTGDTIKFMREESIDQQLSYGHIEINKGTYLLFLNDFTDLKKQEKDMASKSGQTNLAEAYQAISSFCSTSPQAVIPCNEDGSHSKNETFSDLPFGAESKRYDKALQGLVDQYKK